ncbi:MAG: glycine--tRNA ligase subunit beta [Anaerolineales bacterium]|nr:glycine--tRNA ligase subunit beta [Anaerolineales bacterium]
MNKPGNFQSMILALHHYWADQGALIWHPYYSQVGAGTNNPSTFLRVLGPEPFNVGYVEPSVRPDDGRYGDNPNRLQMFYQYQVILKPDPGNPQELYLGSLEAMGIDPHEHDIRFVEDNWESPALGAWGLGWEVWLDGLEITQFTYFQQAGQLNLDPVSVEITYGLDRIAAPLQGVHHFKDIQWSDKRTFGDMNLQGEQEQSKYYFEVADVERNRKMYELAREEVLTALDAGLVMPAYDQLLRLSHLFNVLDTRGAIGVTERQQFFRDMRNLAGKVAAQYLEGRERLEFPWLEDDGGGVAVSVKSAPLKLTAPDRPSPLLFEIGTEELPPSDLDGYLAQLEELVPAMLNDLNLNYGNVMIMGTPRRLVIYVECLDNEQVDREELVKGPPASRAFGPDGEPTRAAEGFARGKGLLVSDLEVRQIDGGDYVVATVQHKGKMAVEVLAERLPELVASLKVERGMRWNSSNVIFSRPIRWLLAMHGEHPIPFEYAGYQAGMKTRGLRFMDPEEVMISHPAEYFNIIEGQGIILDVENRREEILGQVEALAAEVGGEIKPDAALLAEVAHLVEAPTALLGKFEEKYLELPDEVLVMVMKKHQRYFPVYREGKLLPYFVTVRNGGNQHLELIAKGNEAVIRARFADAAFFVDEDLKVSLEEYLPKLDTLTFQTKLGSMLDKTKRISKLVGSVGEQLGLDDDEIKTARRAAELCKADLATKMVVEMTALQGFMGQQYALKSGETEDVALAIYEHYLPRSAGDIHPSTKPGLAVGVADRLDSLAGLFAAGLAPTGNKDPFALRRAALGLVQSLIGWEQDFDLRIGLEQAAELQPVETDEASRAECLDFIIGRMRSQLLEEGFKFDVVDAVLAGQGYNPASASKAVAALGEFVTREDWDQILPAYSRCVRITRDLAEKQPVDPAGFVEPAEKALYAALKEAEAANRQPGSVEDFFAAFLPMIPKINTFFDEVLVMAEDDQVRAHRLGMLQRIAALADGVADMSRLEGF